MGSHVLGPPPTPEWHTFLQQSLAAHWQVRKKHVKNVGFVYFLYLDIIIIYIYIIVKNVYILIYIKKYIYT